MGELNWDLTRIGQCKHKIGKICIFAENDELIFSKHTGKNVVQYWTGRDDEIGIEGWACAHCENDEEEIIKYLLKKETDLKCETNV